MLNIDEQTHKHMALLSQFIIFEADKRHTPREHMEKCGAGQKPSAYEDTSFLHIDHVVSTAVRVLGDVPMPSTTLRRGAQPRAQGAGH